MTTQRVSSNEPYSSVLPSYTSRIEEPIIARHISWGAIFAGSIVAMVVQVMLTLLGAGIGASTVNPVANAMPNAQGLGTGSAIWMGVSLLISLAAGSWVAGRVSAAPRGVDAVIHGLVVWGVTTLAAIYLLTTAAGAFFGGVASVVGSTAQTAAVASPAYSGTVNDQAQRNGISLNSIPTDRQSLITLIQTQQHVSRAEATTIADQRIAQTQQQAKQVGTATATNVSRASIIMAIFMLLGAIVAAALANVGAASLRGTNVVQARNLDYRSATPNR